jgi:hypothetical protein
VNNATTTTAPGNVSRVNDEDIEACRSSDALVRALAIVGRLNADGSEVICPECGSTTSMGKFKIHPDGGFKHFSSGSCWGGKGYGIDLLKRELNIDFLDSVRALVGKPTKGNVVIPTEIPNITVRSFTATPDPELLAGVLAYGKKFDNGAGVRAAHEFYAQWHIHPDVVDMGGAVYITNPGHFSEAIQHRFSLERLIASGLFVMNKNDEPMCLISKKWPVVEPGKDSNGQVTNLQFRASNDQQAKYLLHKEGKLPYEGNQKFVNLRGVPTEKYLGSGLDRIAALPEPSDVFWVEGFKDRLAAETMGAIAYSIPGVSYRPPAEVVETMRRHHNVLALDGDEAGDNGMHGIPILDEGGNLVGRKPGGLVERLVAQDLRVSVKELRKGFDITDSLVFNHAQAGCGCGECVRMRARVGI